MPPHLVRRAGPLDDSVSAQNLCTVINVVFEMVRKLLVHWVRVVCHGAIWGRKLNSKTTNTDYSSVGFFFLRLWLVRHWEVLGVNKEVVVKSFL